MHTNFLTTHFNNKFILFLKDFYPYEDMDDWEKFNETLLLKHSHLIQSIWNILLMQITVTQKEFVKILRIRRISCFLCSK